MHIHPKDLEVVLYERHKEARKVGVDQLEAEVLGDGRILVLRVRLQPHQTPTKPDTPMSSVTASPSQFLHPAPLFLSMCVNVVRTP
jgi:hypothetical protein